MNKDTSDLEALLKELDSVDAASASEVFTTIFDNGCVLLELDDNQAANIFDTSVPNVSRWRRGIVIPPSASFVLRLMRDQLKARLS